MKIITAAMLVFSVGTLCERPGRPETAPTVQQRLPAELQSGQMEDPRFKNSGIVVIGGQTPVITNRQLPSTQIESRSQSQLAGAPFDVALRDAPLRPTLTGLAQAHGLNLVMPPEIEGSVTIDLKNVTLEQALDAILTPRQLQYRIEDSMLRVDKIQMESRTFKFDYITTSRTLSRSLSASSSAGGGGGGGFAGGGAAVGGGGVGGVAGGGGGGGGSSASLSGQEQTNLWDELDKAVNLLKSPVPESRIIFNKMAGLIFATDYPRNLDTIGLFLETIQNSVHRQVVIEAKVVEVKLNDDSQTGVNWTALFGNALRLEQPLGGGGGFQIGATIRDFNALLSTLSTQGKVNVLSAPTISTLNNQPAIIRVGTQDVFFTTTTQVDPRTGSILQTATTPAAINEGIVLDVTPQISDDGIIMMNVHPTITERTGQAVSPRGDTVPIVDVRETDQVVRIKQGEMVFIGGLISDRKLESVNKVPVLGDIPLIGGLFRRTQKESRKIDLAILLTPRVMDIRTAVDYTRERIEAQERLKTEKRP